MKTHLILVAIQRYMSWENIPIKESLHVLNKIKTPLHIDHFYLLGNLWFDPLFLEVESTENIQGFGHSLRPGYSLKTSIGV
jgi:hypothetical protein